MSYPITIPPYAFFTNFTPAIPQFYTNVITMEQGFKELCKQLHKLICYSNEIAKQLNLTDEEVQHLDELFTQFQESGFDDYYKAQIEQWINDNLETIFEHLAKQVFFGLTDDGHFCAYIPDSWSDIQFDTGMVYGNFDYGRLILRFNADGSGVIDNTGRYDDSNTDSLLYRINHLEQTVYTALNRGDI